MLKVKKCTHDYKPHQFIRCEHDDYGICCIVKANKNDFFLP